MTRSPTRDGRDTRGTLDRVLCLELSSQRADGGGGDMGTWNPPLGGREGPSSSVSLGVPVVKVGRDEKGSVPRGEGREGSPFPGPVHEDVLHRSKTRTIPVYLRNQGKNECDI